MRAWADKKFALTEHADAFVAWFGDSKVVDDAGEPLVVHKGMPKKNWQTGEDIKEIQSPNGPWAGFFSDSQSVADRFSKAYSFTTGGSHVVSGYAKIEKPYIIDAKGGAAKTVQFDTLVDVKGVGLRVKVEPKIEAIIKSGKYDGIIVKNTSDEGTIYVPFKSAQVKSTSNSGAFSRDESHIEKSLALKFNPNHDARGRFASGSGSKINPSVGSATSTAPPAAFIAAVAQSKIDNEGWEERLVAHQAVQERLLKKIDAALEKDDNGTPLTPEQKAAYRSAFVNVTDNMNNHAIEALERHLDDVKFYSSAQSLTDKLVGLERMEPGKVILGAWSGTTDGANGSLHLDGGPGGKHDKFAAQQVYAHEVAHAIDWVPGSVTKIPVHKLKVSADEAEKTILARIDKLPISAQQKEAERANVLWNLGEPDSFTAIGVKTDDLYQLTGHRELHRPGREISRSAKWISAHNQEIDALDAKGAQTFPLSRYATTSASEGFAEFGRLVFTAPREAKRQYPKCWAVWLEHGLVGNSSQKKASAE